MGRKKLKHKEEVARKALKGPIPDFLEPFHGDRGAGWECGQTIPLIYPVSARTQGRDCKDNEYNHISWSQSI